MDRLKGKTAIVTGAASGIGRAIAECFATEGATVVLADKNFRGAIEVMRGPAFKGDEHFAREVDVTSDDNVNDMMKGVLNRFGHIDILVNNAGMAGDIGDPFPQNTVENWKRVFDTNTISAVRTVKALWNHFTERREGVILNIASIVGHNRGSLNMKPAYNASKSAIVALTKVMAIDLAPYNVRVNTISPGILWTGFWDHLAGQLKKERPEQYAPDADIYNDVFMKRVREIVPLGKPQDPEDIGKAAVFLASDEARFITGIDLPVDGGVLAR
jgi:3-oxoacyl-[acyl-carrier protein] reductase